MKKDITDQIKYEHVLKLAENVIGNLIQNREDILDLAQVVAMKYHLNIEKAEEEGFNNWIYTIAKNTAIDFLRKKKDISEKAIHFDLVENKITENILDEKRESHPAKILDEFSHNLSEPEKKLLMLYAETGFSIKKLVKRKKMKYQTLKKKIYRLKADLRAKYNLHIGMIGSKKIIGAKLNENLLNFLKKFRKAIENNSLEDMKIYLRECKIPMKIPEIKIKNIVEYDVRLKGDNKYLIFVIYRDENGKNNSFITTFEVYQENSIKIAEFPKPPSIMREFDLKNFPKELLEKIKVNEKGVPDMSREEFEQLLFQYGLIKKKEF